MKKEQLEAKIAELETEKYAYQTGNWGKRLLLEFDPKHLVKRYGLSNKINPTPSLNQEK